MFIGEYSHNIDAKGRVIIPSKFRDELQDSFILTRGLDGCLTIYSKKQWDKLFEEINKLPTTRKAARQYIRVLTSGASEVSLDNQGRIQVPSFLLKAVSLKKECYVIGANDHVEIWDRDVWDNYYAEASESFEDVAENISDFFLDE